MGSIQEKCQSEMIFHQQHACLQFSNAKKEGRTPTSRKTNENDNDHAMNKCDQNLSGKVGIVGKATGRRHHLHLQQIGSSQENGTNHSKKNCKISNCGKSGEHNTVFQSHQPFYKNLAQSLCFSHFAYRDWRMSYTRLGVKTAHFVRVTQAFFSCCVRMTVAQDTSSTHMRGPKDMWIVLCVSAWSSTVVRSSHVSSYTSCHTSSCTVFTAKCEDEHEHLCCSARRSPPRLNGRTELCYIPKM